MYLINDNSILIIKLPVEHVNLIPSSKLQTNFFNKQANNIIKDLIILFTPHKDYLWYSKIPACFIISCGPKKTLKLIVM